MNDGVLTTLMSEEVKVLSSESWQRWRLGGYATNIRTLMLVTNKVVIIDGRVNISRMNLEVGGSAVDTNEAL